MALAEIQPAIPRVDSLPAVDPSADGQFAERVILAIIAVLAAVLVPGHASQLIDTPLTWADLTCGLRPERLCALASR